MKPMISLLLLVFCLLATPLAAQDGFVVMSLKGKVEAKAPGKKSAWQEVKVGDVLGKRHIVRTSFASYVKIMAAGKRLISIDENSTKELSELVATQRASTKGGASAGLLEYAAAQVKKSRSRQDDPVFGAVRGNTEVFSAVFPKNVVMTTAPMFEWVDGNEAGEYQFLLLDDGFDVIARASVKELRMQYEGQNLPALDADREYFWRITRLSDGMDSDIQSFRILPADTIAAVREELTRLDEELTAMGADSVTLHLIRAIYFEKRGLYSDAFVEYKETVRLAPEVEEYREMLRGLLFRMKLYAEEEYLLPNLGE